MSILLRSLRTVLSSVKLRKCGSVSACRHVATRTLPKTGRQPQATAQKTLQSNLNSAQKKWKEGQQRRLSPSENQKVAAATRLYNAGVRQVYKAPSHIGILAFSWAVGIFFVGTTLDMIRRGLYQVREDTGLSSGQRWTIQVANRLIMIFCTVVGGWVVLRYRGLVQSMQLVPGGPQGGPALRVAVRRLVPVLPPKLYTVPSYEVRHALRPVSSESELTGTAGGASKLLFSCFKKFRQFLTKERFVATTIDKGQIHCLIDARGTFNPSVPEVEAILTATHRWER